MSFRGLAASLILLSTVAGASATDIYKENADWRIEIHSEIKQCLAVQRVQGARFIGLGITPDALTVSVVDQKLSWLTQGKQYDAVLQIDRTKWQGKMDASRYDDSGALHAYSVGKAFAEAFMRGNSMKVTVDGTPYGPYTLKGTKNVVYDLLDCLEVVKRSSQSSKAPEPRQPEPQRQEPQRQERQAEPAPREQAAPPPREQAASSRNIEIFPDELQEWTGGDIGKTFTIDDVTVTLSTRKKPDGAQAVMVDVLKKGGRSVSFEADVGASPAGSLGMFRLAPGLDEQQLFFTNHTGGAHCCTEVRVVDFTSNKPKVIDLGSFDAGSVEPTDIDGDNHAELVLPDQRFLRFDSYANAFPPHRIVTLENGESKDVTREPRFVAYHEKLYAQQSEACGFGPEKRMGACAGLLGTAAILGVFEPTLEHLDLGGDNAPPASTPYEICPDEQCKNPKKFPFLKDALIEAVNVWGYASKTPASPEFLGEMRKLMARKFGAEEAGNEMSCDSAPLELKEKMSALGAPMFTTSEYESYCVVSDGVAVGQSVVARAVCAGEGSPPSLENRIYAADGDMLKLATLHSLSPEGISVLSLKQCPAKAEK